MDPTEEKDPLCECGDLLSNHMVDHRPKGGDFCLGVHRDEKLGRDVSCLCKKFEEAGKKPVEQSAEKPAPTEVPAGNGKKPWE